MKEKILISACLIGENVKYNGKNNKIDLSILEDRYDFVPFCPEVEGGLPTPRAPSEIISNKPLKLINSNGEDVTDFFINGAKKCTKLVQKLHIKRAIMKANSPSCSNKFIYDGTFSSKLKKGDGVTVQFLKREGVKVYNEEEIEKLLTQIKG